MDQESRPNRPTKRQGPRRENIDTNRLKDSVRLSDVVARFTQLRPSGRSRIGLCPFHQETRPSLVVTDELGAFYCHGCQTHGDVIDFVRTIQRCGFMDAVRYISGQIPATTVPLERERAKKLEKAKRELAGAYARCQWKDARAPEGTPAETYIRSRGLTCAIPPTLRYGVFPLWISLVTGRKGPRLPALIAACQNADGAVIGVQKIFLQPDGSRAPLPRPKVSLGAIKGGALRLGPAAEQIIVCEGPEDGLTLHQMLPSIPVWVALGSGNIPAMKLPPEVRRVLVAGDNNPAGRKAAQDACEAFRSQGRQATAIFPDSDYEDFNDELRGIKKRGSQDAGGT